MPLLSSVSQTRAWSRRNGVSNDWGGHRFPHCSRDYIAGSARRPIQSPTLLHDTESLGLRIKNSSGNSDTPAHTTAKSAYGKPTEKLRRRSSVTGQQSREPSRLCDLIEHVAENQPPPFHRHVPGVTVCADDQIGAPVLAHQCRTGRPQPPLHRISFHRISHRFRHNKTTAKRSFRVSVTHRHQATVKGRFFSTPKNYSEILRRKKPMSPIQHNRSATLGREFLAALPPTGSDDGTPSAGAHARTEAVVFRTTACVGLKGALGHVFLLKVKAESLRQTDTTEYARTM